MQNDPTLADVARHCGLSTATVSRVLNDSPVPTAATRAKVLASVRKLNFRLNLQASNLRRQALRRAARRMDAVGLLLYDLDESTLFANDFYRRIFLSLEEATEARETHLLVAKLRQGAFLPRMVRDMKVDGVIIAGHIPDELAAPIAERVSAVLFNYRPDNGNASSVMVDNPQAIRRAMDYLLDLGHRRIAFVGRNTYSHLHIAERWDAYQRVAHDLALRIYEDFSVSRDGAESARRNVRRFLQLGSERPTALICAGDVTARCFIEEARQHGIEVPRDVSVVGFDDTLSATNKRPFLTTLHQPLEEMAQEAVNLVLQGNGEPERTHRRTLMEASLVKRDSCGPPPALSSA